MNAGMRWDETGAERPIHGFMLRRGRTRRPRRNASAAGNGSPAAPAQPYRQAPNFNLIGLWEDDRFRRHAFDTFRLYAFRQTILTLDDIVDDSGRLENLRFDGHLVAR
jgi:hypothetical protein